MRRFLLQSSLVLALLLTSVTAASGGPRGTFSYNEEGRALAHSSATINVAANSTIVLQKFLLQPGFKGLWPAEAGNTLILVKHGALATYAHCTDKEMWEAGHAYFRPGGDGEAGVLVKNEGKEAAELVAAFFNAPSGQPAGAVPAAQSTAGECAAPGAFSPTEIGRVVTYGGGKIEMEAGKQVVVQSFLVEPGFNFFWHKHPGPTVVLQKRGTITEYMNCTEKLVWEPGYAYLHAPGHHGHAQETAKNEGKDTADFVVLFFNVPEWHPAPLVPRNVEPPPDGCPTASLS
jgi:hypothetical protein